MLVVFAFGTSADYFLIFDNQTAKTEEIAADSNVFTTTTTAITTAPCDIPEIYFMIPVLAVLIL